MQKEESIKCVKRATWDLILKDLKDYRRWIVSVAIACFVVFVFFVVVLGFSSLYILGAFLLNGLTYYLFLREKVRKRFMMDFALVNGFDYQENLPVESVRGNIFNFGNSKKIIHAVLGEYKNKKIRLFKYETRTGGWPLETHSFTVFEIFFKKLEFPSIILQAKKGRGGIFRPIFIFRKNINAKEIKIEEEFEKNFTLSCANGYEIEALQVFNPQTLRFLKERNSKFSIEMIEDRLYIYKESFISKEEELYELYEVVQLIINSLGPLLKRLRSNFEILHQYYKK